MDDDRLAHVWAVAAAFWLIAPLVGLLSNLPRRWDDALRPHLPRLGYLIATTCLALWLLQLSTDPGTGLLPATWPSPQRWLALAIVVIAWVAVLWWAFPAHGARRIADEASADARLVQAGFVLVIGASAAMTFVQYRVG